MFHTKLLLERRIGHLYNLNTIPLLLQHPLPEAENID
jgi:hypothetical protein